MFPICFGTHNDLLFNLAGHGFVVLVFGSVQFLILEGAMASEKNAVALTGFFSSLFHNLPRLLLTNVLFALPFAVIFGIFFLINTLTGLNSMFIYFLKIIPLFPFYAGVTQVTSHMVMGE